MSMQTDVKAVTLAASGAITDARARVRSLVIEPGTSAGSVVLRDGGAGGTVLFTINTTANGETFSVLIPEQGVLCLTSAFATLTNAKVTVFHG
jgi:hypothetical protein